jgi:hypothetical protein
MKREPSSEKKNNPIFVVYSGIEPSNFTRNFHAWDSEKPHVCYGVFFQTVIEVYFRNMDHTSRNFILS